MSERYRFAIRAQQEDSRVQRFMKVVLPAGVVLSLLFWTLLPLVGALFACFARLVVGRRRIETLVEQYEHWGC